MRMYIPRHCVGIRPSSILPPIRPTGTVNTPLRLLTNVLPTELALDLLLHDIIPTAPTIRQRNHPQRHSNSHKPHNLVKEVSISQYHGAVVNCLGRCVVPVGYSGVVVWPVFEDSEFLVEVAGEEGEERYDWEDDIGYEGVCAGGEGGCKAMEMLVHRLSRRCM
jgi:hypothetical protein